MLTNKPQMFALNVKMAKKIKTISISFIILLCISISAGAGTQATMGEVLEYEAEKNSKVFSYEREADINEVLNYRKAMWHAIEMLKNLPLCQRVIKETHQVAIWGSRAWQGTR